MGLEQGGHLGGPGELGCEEGRGVAPTKEAEEGPGSPSLLRGTAWLSLAPSPPSPEIRLGLKWPQKLEAGYF